MSAAEAQQSDPQQAQRPASQPPSTDQRPPTGQGLRESEPTSRRRALLERTLGATPFTPGIWGILIPAAVTLMAGLMRLWNLSTPHSLIFDETYYAKDAYALLQAGYELVWPEEANDAWLDGDPQPTDEASYVVHPPLGKWLIALGLALFGPDSALGWRFSAAIAGTLGVLLVTLIAQRMFRSVFLGAIAGVLTAVEGHHLVMSRIALLDIFLMLFVLAAFGALIADRYQARRRLAAWAAETPQDAPERAWGPVLWFRPWQLAAAVALGCAVGVKLSALSFIPVFGVMVVLWDIQARRTVGVRRWLVSGLVRDGLPAMLRVLPLLAATYVLTWSGWLLNTGGWGRDWHEHHPPTGLGHLVPGPPRSLWNYHASATDFHTGLDAGHEYASHPWTWLFMGRPVSMHYTSVSEGEVYEHTGEVCGPGDCSSAVLDIANPLIWWAGLAAVVVVLAGWIGRRDWRYGAILSGWAAGFAVWLLFPDRTMFFFYTISYHPFLILGVVMVIGLLLRAGTSPVRSDGSARSQGALVATQQRNTVLALCFVLMCVAVSVFFWPIWTGELIPYEQWDMRIWIQSWF